MGFLGYFDLPSYKADILIETGTGIGSGISHALNFNFEKIYSCEIVEQLFTKNKLKFKDNKNIHLYNLSSIDYLKEVLPSIPKDKRIVFWLDAHFPGADYVTQMYQSTNDEINLPLVHEIKLINELRDISNDVFLIDDLRIIEPYDKENLEKVGLYLDYPGLEFIYTIFDKTHSIKNIIKMKDI